MFNVEYAPNFQNTDNLITLGNRSVENKKIWVHNRLQKHGK